MVPVLHRPLKIAEAELRSVEIWLHVLQMVAGVRGSELLSLTDNAVVAGLLARGRSARKHLNRIMRGC